MDYPDILLITNYWKGGQGGGIFTYLCNLRRSLECLGSKVRVISRRGKDNEQLILPYSKIQFVLLTFWQLRKRKPEVLLSSNDWSCLVPAYFYKVFYGGQLVHIFHTWPEKKTNPFIRKLMNFCFRRCDQVIFVSDALRQYMREEDKIVVRDSIVLRAGFPPAIRQNEPDKAAFLKKWNIKESDIVLCTQAMTAHAGKARGVVQLMKAVQPLMKEYPIKLLVTKDGKYVPALKKEAQLLGITHQVIFTGDVDNVYLPLSVSDLYVHITYAEGGVSLSILEAISKSVPVIATPVGGIKELLRDDRTALLVSAEPREIQDAILTLLNDREKADLLAKTAFQELADQFDWNKNARELLTALNWPRTGALTISSNKVHNKVI